ncbi:MAG: CaiB/BaiF CoA-transferase family protein [Pseudomonadota bacterium]
MAESDRTGPLTNIRVIELGQLIAGPFCGQLLADMGADVIKVEPPGVGDPIRSWGREGFPLWWKVCGRNKRCVTANLRVEDGQDLVRRLVDHADILIENFRPGTVERWGLGYDALSAINPKLIMVRVSGYGQTGPYAHKPGYASVGEAMGGMRHLCGEPDRPASRAGLSIGDTLAATYACNGALAALHAREHTGRGQIIDASIFESVLNVMEATIPEYAIEGHIRGRSGSKLPNIAPSNVYTCKDGDYIIAANQDTIFKRLAEAMGQPELADNARYATHVARGANQDELDSRINDWTRTKTVSELEALMDEHAVPSGKIYRAPDMLEDPHYDAREAIVEVEDETWGKIPMQNTFPRFSHTQGEVRWAGPDLGQHNQDIFGGLLGLDEDELSRLAEAGVI